MLDADGALVLAGAAGGALEDGLLGVVFAEERFFTGGAEVVEVGADAEDDFLGIEGFSGGGGGAMLGAAAALDAGVGLEGDELGEVFSGDEAEVFIADEGRDVGESAAGEEDGERGEDEVEVLGVGDQRQEDEQGEGVEPPEDVRGRAAVCYGVGGQVGGHEGEDEAGDESGLPAEFVAGAG